MTLPLTILATLTAAATATGGGPPTVEQVDAWTAVLQAAGPWLFGLLMVVGYLDVRRREGVCQAGIAAVEKKHEETAAALNRRIDELQEKRISESEHDSATLLAHAQAMGKIIEANTVALDKLSERIRG